MEREAETGITIEEVRAKGHFIEHKHEGLIEIWVGLGRKCKYCPCFMMNSVDYQLHQGVHLDYTTTRWFPSTHGDKGEYAAADKLPMIAELIRYSGQWEKDGFVFTLSPNGKWILRRKPFQ